MQTPRLTPLDIIELYNSLKVSKKQWLAKAKEYPAAYHKGSTLLNTMTRDKAFNKSRAAHNKMMRLAYGEDALKKVLRSMGLTASKIKDTRIKEETIFSAGYVMQDLHMGVVRIMGMPDMHEAFAKRLKDNGFEFIRNPESETVISGGSMLTIYLDYYYSNLV
jgi:hypothetical protein